VASDLLKLVEDIPCLPGFSCMAEGLVAFYGTLQLAASFGRPLELEQGIGKVIADCSCVVEIALYSRLYRR
jgi:hypothetical protein